MPGVLSQGIQKPGADDIRAQAVPTQMEAPFPRPILMSGARNQVGLRGQ